MAQSARFVTITVTKKFDRLPSIITEIKQLNNLRLEVGIFEGTGKAAIGATIAQYAAYNEFGTMWIPERPFMREATSRHSKRWQAMAEKGFKAIIAGRANVQQVLTEMGIKMQADIRATIRASHTWAEKLQQSTIDAKNSSKPLIDTGAMLMNVKWRIVYAP